MSFDDDELVPEILNFFDEFCSRIDDRQIEINGHSSSSNPSTSARRTRSNSSQSGAPSQRLRVSALKLTRRSSLGRLCGDISSSQLSVITKAPVVSNENVDWKKKFEELQRQYDMKCGELTNTAESANQRYNSLLSTIRNLEATLNNERLESIKSINALQSQLSFKEADYRLITTELQNCKNLLIPSQSALITKETFPLISQVPNSAIASPGSYLLTQEAERVEANYSIRAGPLPRSVSPVATRGPMPKRPRLCCDDRQASTSTSSGVLITPPSHSYSRPSIPLPDLSESANPPTPTKSRAQDLSESDNSFLVDASPPFRSPGLQIIEKSPFSGRKMEENDQYPAASSSTLTPNRSTTPESEALDSVDSLDFRIQVRRPNKGKQLEVSRTVVGQLTSLLANSRNLPRDPEIPGQDISLASEAEQASTEFDFFKGLSQLTLNSKDSSKDDCWPSFNRCVQLTLPQIRLRFREYVNFFRLFREKVFDHRFTEHWKFDEISREECPVSMDSESFSLENFAENPFAGAPASQLVSIPSLSCSKSASTIRSSVVEVNEPSTWLESSAKQANEGILACLRQTKVLFHTDCKLDHASIDGIGAFILEIIDSLSTMLTITPLDGEFVLNSLPLLWMSRLTRVIYECFDFASQFALELCKLSKDSSQGKSPWLPSILDVFILMVSSMCSKTTLEDPPVLLPALRLLALLLESGNLESPPDPDVQPASAPNPSVYWFSSDKDPGRGFELLSKLVELEKSYAERDQTYVPYFASRFLSKKISSSTHLRCPLLLLCRLLFIEQHMLDSEDTFQHCRLLTEFSKFTVALTKTKDWAQYPYSPEIYKALLRLCNFPSRWISRSSSLSVEQSSLCMGSLGCAVKALQALLCHHKYKRFKYITDRIPGFFTTISTLSHVGEMRAHLAHPDLVYELHDFDRPAKSKKPKKRPAHKPAYAMLGLSSMNSYAHVPSCSSLSDAKRRNLAHRLFQIGALNFSGVQLKTGEVTPVYFDIRLTMSDPLLLQEITESMYEMVCDRTSHHKFDLVTGVPAAAVALATSVSIQQNLPMILTRKAVKDHGTKKLIEGVWTPGQEVLIVEDVVTYGDSISETVELLRSMGLVVRHALVVVERQQGATQNLLHNYNVNLHALLTFDDILNILNTDGLVSSERVEVARSFIASAQFSLRLKQLTDTFPPISRNLLGLKSVNKCLSIDVPMSSHKILEIAKKEGGSIDALEITPQLVQYDSENFISELVRLAELHAFLLIANCKLLGDESSARAALDERSYLSPCKWADIVTVCPLSPPEIFNAFRLLRKSSSLRSHLSVLLIADFGLEEKCIEMAAKNPDVVLGFVSLKPLCGLATTNGEYSSPSVIYQVPDVHCPLEKNGHIVNDDHPTTKDKFNDPSIGLLRTVYFSSMNGL
ncbi:unnamed protein product [Rodentolepis nana]|uniref:orotate phosphoribosyltransferase n=1 Tax=Rodentolepis nana TaxID=102285 RepID=A0A0R3TRU8_RODNA|nr:unnamed protein product [Rodentolepis nana]